MIDEKKMAKKPLPAPTASAIGPCPISIQISRREIREGGFGWLYYSQWASQWLKCWAWRK